MLSTRGSHFVSFIINAGFMVYLVFLIIFLEQSDDKCLGTSKGDRAFLTAVEVITFLQAISVGIQMFTDVYTMVTGELIFQDYIAQMSFKTRKGKR